MNKLTLLVIGSASVFMAHGAAAGSLSCPAGTQEGKAPGGVVRCIDNGHMTCPDKFHEWEGEDHHWHCLSKTFGAKCNEAAHERPMKDVNGKEHCVAADFDKCNPGYFLEKIGRELHCVSDAHEGKGASPAEHGAAHPPAHGSPASSGAESAKGGSGAWVRYVSEKTEVEPKTPTCPKKYTFIYKLKGLREGNKIPFYFVRSDGGKSEPRTMDIRKGLDITVEDHWEIGASMPKGTYSAVKFGDEKELHGSTFMVKCPGK